MPRKPAAPRIEVRRYTLADGPVSETFSVRWFDAFGKRMRKACASREEADFERARSQRSGATSRATTANGKTPSASNGNGNGANGGVTETMKNAAIKARGPAVALGAVAAGVAGGVALRSHTRRRTVLGVPIPRSLAMDPKTVAKTVGHASRQFAKTSKSVSRDIERAGEQAERIGKILS